MGFTSYIKSICKGIGSLCTGLKTTMKVFLQKNTTDQYPENRATLHIAKRFRGELYMPLKEDGSSRCIGCGICENACPNGTITVKTKMEINPATGKPKKVLDEYIYDLGSCTFCQLCVTSCPYSAIDFRNEFENAVFNRQKLIMRLDPILEPKPQPVEVPAADAKPAEPVKQEAPAAAEAKAEAPAAEAKPEAPAPAQEEKTEEKQPENN